MENTCICCGAIIPEGRQICADCKSVGWDMNNSCVCCGAIIPEGRQVCFSCERKWPEF